jgi:hypothetical protein
MKQIFNDDEVFKQKALSHNNFPKYINKSADDWKVINSELHCDFISSEGKQMYYCLYFDTNNNLIFSGRYKS